MEKMCKGSTAKWIAAYLIVATVVIGTVQRLYAGFSPSTMVLEQRGDREGDIQKIQKVLETKMVAQRLEQLGFTDEEIQARLDRLSDQEIHQLAGSLDQLEVAGNGVGLVVGLLVIGILVLLFVFLFQRVT